MITSQNTTETGNFRLVTEASDLGWPPGHWPASVPTDLGNKQPFIRAEEPTRDREGELQSVTYRQALGCLILIIYND